MIHQIKRLVVEKIILNKEEKMTREEILSMPAGRETDALIAEKLMEINLWYGDPTGFDIPENIDYWVANEKDNEGELYIRCPYYSTKISAAWDIIEAIRQKQIPIQIRGDEWYDGGGWIVEIMDILGKKVKYSSYIETTGPNRGIPNVCLAVCRVALLFIFKL
jgi:hypothetical protein